MSGSAWRRSSSRSPPSCSPCPGSSPARPGSVPLRGYPPARLYWYDSFTYLHNAVHLRPEQGFHPIGYPLLLRALLPFHSVEVVVAAQHAMGLATGVVVYTALRRGGLPGWAAVAASAPVLFDASFLRLEHAVLSDSLFILLVVAATALRSAARCRPRAPPRPPACSSREPPSRGRSRCR